MKAFYCCRSARFKELGGAARFEQALDELDTLVRQMESGQLSLDESIAAYRRGAELARFCQSKLANAEQEIKRLEGDLLKPLDISELRGGVDKSSSE